MEHINVGDKTENKVGDKTENKVGDKTVESRLALHEELRLLSEKCKALESDYNLDPQKWTVLRVDGHKFSTFTTRFDSRFDEGLVNAMLLAAEDWLKDFQGASVYVESDEATLLIAPVNTANGATLPFNGRVGKLTTLSAGLFSTKFNKYLETKHQGDAYFDCRAFQVDTIDDLQSVIRWRQLDAFRNGISVLARMFGERKKVDKMNTGQKLEYIKEHGAVAEEYIHLLHGTFIKKELVNIGLVIRTKLKRWNASQDFIIKTPSGGWLTSKYYVEEKIV